VTRWFMLAVVVVVTVSLFGCGARDPIPMVWVWPF